MERKKYVCPMASVIVLQVENHLLAGSGSVPSASFMNNPDVVEEDNE